MHRVLTGLPLLSVAGTQLESSLQFAMARFVLALLAVSVTICLASVINAAPQDNLVGKVFFLEGGHQEYLRQTLSEDNVEDEAISGGDNAAAIAVLLGIPPPLFLSPAASARLDSLLSPNPFKRPHAVIALTIRGITSESPRIEEIEEILELHSSVQQRPLYANGFQRPHELPGTDVVIQSLNNGEYTLDLEQGLKALVSLLEGVYEEGEEAEKITLIVPFLTGDLSMSLDLEERADRSFAEELLALFHSTQSVSGQYGGEKAPAKLFLGTFSALELMEEGSDHRRDATKLFLHTAARVLSVLEAKYDGKMVGVFSLLSGAPGTRVLPMFSIKDPRSSRSLLVQAAAPSPAASSNETLFEAEIEKLLSRSLLLVTVLILLIASGLGSCFLLFMPLTRDTLLYANVKLD